MATGDGGGGVDDGGGVDEGGASGDGRDDRDLAIADAGGRPVLPGSPTALPGTFGASRSAGVGGDERGEDGNIFNSDDVEARAAAKLAQVWKANPGRSHHFTSGLGGVE